MMDLEETEDEERDTIITSTSQHWSEPNANSGNKVNCMLERGLNVGRKMLVLGFVATSVPLVVPGFVVASAIGLVVSVPYCFFLVSHRCTQNLMNKLLPKPRVSPQGQGQGPLLFENVCFKQDIDKEDEGKRDNEMVDVSEENMMLDNDYEQGVVNEEFEPELLQSGDAGYVVQHNGSEKDGTDYFSEEEVVEEEPSSHNHDDEKLGGKIYGGMEGHLSGESNVERSISRGAIMEGCDEKEEFKAPFEFGDATVVLEECGDEVKESDIEEEEMKKETKGLLEKIRDEGRNDMRGEYATGISSGTSESDQDIGLVVENMEVGQEEKHDLGTDGEMWNQEDSKVCEETVQSRNNDNTDSVYNEVESCEPTKGILELEDDGLSDSKKPVDETSKLLDGRSFQDKPIGDLLIETQAPHILVAEKNMILDTDYEQGIGDEEFEPELSHHSGDTGNVVQHDGSEKDGTDYFSEKEEKVEEEPLSQNHDEEKMEGRLSGESSEEMPMSGGVTMEGFDETEEFKALFEFGDATVVLEECGDEVKEGDIEEEEMKKETKGLLENIGDEGSNDMRGEYAKRISSRTSESDQDIGQVFENMEEGQEEKQDLGTVGKIRNQEGSKVCEETVQSRNDDNSDSIGNEVESCEPTSGILEFEGLNDSKKPVDETSELLDGRGFQDEPIGDLLIETQALHILVAEDSSEVEKLEPAISNLVNQETKLHEYDKRMNSSDADTNVREIVDEIELHSCDENKIDKINAEAYSCTIDLHEEPSNVTADMHTDSMEVLVSSEELESRSSECSSEKNIVCPSDEILFKEANIWRQIHVVRKIIGYEDAIQASCADELKALYVFTGVEAPIFIKENPFDLAEIDEKLRILMSIVGI